MLTNEQIENYKPITNTTDLNRAFIVQIKVELADEIIYNIHDKLILF